MADWAEEWLAHAATHVRPRTHEEYTRWVKIYITPYIGRIKLEKLMGREVQALLDKLAASHRPRVAQLTRVTLGMMMNHALELGVLHRSPVQSTRAPKSEKRPMSIWTPEQARTFLGQLRGHRLESAFYLAITTGMRKGEILGLRWSDLERDRLHVRQSVAVVSGVVRADGPKTQTSRRTILLTPDIVAQLERRRAAWQEEKDHAETWEGDYILSGKGGGPMSPHNFDTVWQRERAQSGLPQIRFHDLRHTYATLALARGADIATLSERLGHADSSITLKVYVHVLDEQKKRLNLSLDDLLGGASSSATTDEAG
ncbi:site-specific integrase [uncultured Deinococcus sp.]|uniref:tyrosine-type recombinase/integrase n=1 Tax=uncultured Deinococcus sp. TaxID=158789 RepID=UPI002590196C|nr:site-specific integrase [uncultured Deinococcus sp.]